MKHIIIIIVLSITINFFMPIEPKINIFVLMFLLHSVPLKQYCDDEMLM